MKYYFDTSVWIAYFNKDEPYHEETVMWFEKVKCEGHELYVSKILDNEMSRSPFYREYYTLSRQLCKPATFNETDFQQEIKHLKMKGFGSGDIKQIILCKVNTLAAVTIDIGDWPKIARELDFFVYYVADIYLL